MPRKSGPVKQKARGGEPAGAAVKKQKNAKQTKEQLDGQDDIELETWLREKCGMQEQQAVQVAERFATPEYGVLDTATLFALEDEDLDEILGPLPLGPRRLVAKMVDELRPEEDD
jgi:hypothetical protein